MTASRAKEIVGLIAANHANHRFPNSRLWLKCQETILEEAKRPRLPKGWRKLIGEWLDEVTAEWEAVRPAG